MEKNGKDREGFFSSLKNKNRNKNRYKKIAAVAAGAAVVMLVLLLSSCGTKAVPDQEIPPETGTTGESAGTAGSGAVGTADGSMDAADGASAGSTGQEAAEAAGTGKTGVDTAAAAATGADTATAVLSPGMEELEKQLGAELKEKEGDWSLYLYRFDTGEEIGINAGESMISASLIKLYIAGCYLEKVENKEMADDYQNQLFLMLSRSDNDSTNRLIDLLGIETVNDFIKEHHFSAGQLNRRMLEQNGTENYTSAKDCGKVLRAVYEGTYVSKEASDRIMEALRAQVDWNRSKIPAGVPADVETANKTGELFTKNGDGVNVDVQNDAAVIFAEDHPYVLVVMSAVPGEGEAALHAEIAELSREVYGAVCR
ncbi:MAG: serine hydrolase [Eubacteriales bacterium]|nr:serine hydrolase [Sarcina sp.]MDO4418332.1 serine hydrolase [Eubacteriales bacterium]